MSDATTPNRVTARRQRSGRAAARRPRRRTESLGATGALALLVGGALLLIALGNNAARESADNAQVLFWGGLVLLYTPIAFRLISPSSSRAECLALSMLLGAGLFVVKVLYSPTGFIPHDEMATLRQTWELLETGRFFSANPVVQGYAGYPGLEAVTAALAKISAHGTFVLAMIVIGAARVTLMLALFLFLERAARSYRVAAIGIAVYSCNPSFLYFDSQFGYESLALTLGAALLLMSLRWATATKERSWNMRGLVAAMAVLATTLVMTHHLTSYAILAFLLIWALTIHLGRHDILSARIPATREMDPSRTPGFRWYQGPVLPALFIAVAGAVWLIFVAGKVTSSELGSVFTGAFESVTNLLTGKSGSKTLFESGSSQTNTTVARILGVSSIIPFLVAIPFGLWMTWAKRGSNALWRTLALVALLYPITLGLRLTQAGTETSQRASEFVFVGLAFVSGLILANFRQPERRSRQTVRTAALTALATMIFVGGFIVGESPITRQPGPFLVGGESRAVSPQGLAAARFAAEHLPPRSRILVDRVNGTLLAALGHLDPVIGQINGIPVSRVFFSKTYDRADQAVISEDAIDYIVVDRRFVEAVPASGYYYESGEPSGGRDISRESLQKFANLEGLDRIYDNGAIAIYDTAGLRSRP